MNAGSFRRLFVALIAVLAMAALASSASAKTEDIIAPSDPHNPTAIGLAGGTCKEEPPEAPDLLGRHARNSSSKRPPPTPNGASPSSSSSTNRPGPSKRRSANSKTVRVDLPVGLSVNPGATPQCPTGDLRSGAGRLPAGSQVGESAVTASLLGRSPPPPTR